MAEKISPALRLLQRFLATRPISWLMSRILHHADAFLLRASRGRLTFAQFSGLPIIQLTTTGARSGRVRTLPLAALPDGENYVLIASNFGSARHPAWYHNLKANPECLVRESGRSRAYVARETDGDQRERYWRLAVSYYLGYEAYRRRAADRKIPVMLLEPKELLTASP